MKLFSFQLSVKDEFYDLNKPGPTMMEIDVFAMNRTEAEEIVMAMIKEPDHFDIDDVVEY